MWCRCAEVAFGCGGRERVDGDNRSGAGTAIIGFKGDDIIK